LAGPCHRNDAVESRKGGHTQNFSQGTRSTDTETVKRKPKAKQQEDVNLATESLASACKTPATEKTRVKTKPIAARRDLRILRHPPHSEKWKKNREKDRLCQPIKIEKSPKEFRLTSENIGKIAFRKLPLLSKYAAYG
jgi:hypothetical protein